MFQIQVENIFFIYCVIITAIAGALWLRNAVRRATPQSDISAERLCRCRQCSHNYLISRYESMSRCPQCTEVNHITERTRI